MRVSATHLTDVFIIEPDVYRDPRGYFLETFRQSSYKEILPKVEFVQDNHSRSAKHVLRGLHYQWQQPQGKLVWVSQGTIFDVAVDIRQESNTFGKWVGVILDDQSCKQLYIPPGFAHGFCVLSDEVSLHYKCTDYYHHPSDISICWNDPAINIDWPISDPLLSEKDQNSLLLKDVPNGWLP